MPDSSAHRAQGTIGEILATALHHLETGVIAPTKDELKSQALIFHMAAEILHSHEQHLLQQLRKLHGIELSFQPMQVGPSPSEEN